MPENLARMPLRAENMNPEGNKPSGFFLVKITFFKKKKVLFRIKTVDRKYDLYYIENWTMVFDMKILILTIFKGFFDGR